VLSGSAEDEGDGLVEVEPLPVVGVLLLGDGLAVDEVDGEPLGLGLGLPDGEVLGDPVGVGEQLAVATGWLPAPPGLTTPLLPVDGYEVTDLTERV
jgi:hypothetical protein